MINTLDMGSWNQAELFLGSHWACRVLWAGFEWGGLMRMEWFMATRDFMNSALQKPSNHSCNSCWPKRYHITEHGATITSTISFILWCQKQMWPWGSSSLQPFCHPWLVPSSLPCLSASFRSIYRRWLLDATPVFFKIMRKCLITC